MSSSKKLIQLSSEELIEVYQWAKQFPLTREIRNINRDMMDGVLVAEILKFLYPKLVDLHNYTRCSGTRNKLDNWETLNRKVLRRLGIYLDGEMMYDMANGKNGMLEILLFNLMARCRVASHESYQLDVETD